MVTATTQEQLQKFLSELPAIEHYEASLKDVALLDPQTVEISGTKLPLSKSGQSSMCRLLEIPRSFSTRLHADDEELWKIMTTRLEELRNTDVRFSVETGAGDKQFACAFNKKGTPWIPNTEFAKMVDYFINKVAKQPITLKVIESAGTGGASAKMIVQNDKIAIAPGSEDIFSLGIDFCNSEILAFNTSLNVAIERLVCSNRAAVREKEYKYAARHSGSFESLVASMYDEFQRLISKNVTVEHFVKTRIHRMTRVNASLREVDEAYRLLSGQPNLKDHVDEEQFPIVEYSRKYGLEYPVKGKSERWMSTAETPLNLYELYNRATWVSSNGELVTGETRLWLEIGLGKLFLSKEPDLMDIAPSIKWN